jgi:serine/threonine protein kinase
MLTALQRIREAELIPILSRMVECEEKTLEQVLRHGGSPVDGLSQQGRLQRHTYRKALAQVRPAIVPFGPFEVHEEIGRGASGVVYRATVGGTVVALKLLREEVVPDRFEREADLLARLDHPRIVRLLQRGKREGAHFLATELVDGASLADYQVPWPLDRALSTAIAIADGLIYAHAQGVIHRDLKPANVLLDSALAPKLVDFGLAKDLHGETLTRSHALVGSPSYSAPEQLTSARHVDARADVYALGAIVHWLVVGQPPFPAESLGELLPMLRAGFQPLRSLPGVPPHGLERLNAIWLRTLTVDLKLRIPTVDALRAELIDALARLKPA